MDATLMKRLLAILLLLCGAASAQILTPILMGTQSSGALTPALDGTPPAQYMSCTTPGCSAGTNTFVGAKAGEYLVAVMGNADNHTPTINAGSNTGGAACTWSAPVCSGASPPGIICLAYCKVVSNGDETFNWSAAVSTYLYTNIAQVKNIAATSPLDCSGTAAVTATANPSVTTSTATTVANDALFSVANSSVVLTNTDTTVVPGTTFQWRLGTNGATQTSSWTSASGDTVAVNICLKPGP